jgi:hypothetical protein
MISFHKKADKQLKQDVEIELRWDPSVTFDKIKVAADDGMITLSGSVPHYSEKTSAERAAQRVGGVRAVADELEVILFPELERSDEDIARSAMSVLEFSYSVPEGVKVAVDKGCSWRHERGG